MDRHGSTASGCAWNIEYLEVSMARQAQKQPRSISWPAIQDEFVELISIEVIVVRESNKSLVVQC